jgi:hypothetical protein
MNDMKVTRLLGSKHPDTRLAAESLDLIRQRESDPPD